MTKYRKYPLILVNVLIALALIKTLSSDDDSTSGAFVLIFLFLFAGIFNSYYLLLNFIFGMNEKNKIWIEVLFHISLLASIPIFTFFII